MPACLESPVLRGLAVSGVVGTIVSVGHAWAPRFAGWRAVHVALPLVVFAASAWLSGARVATRRLWKVGAATVFVVSASFTIVNEAGGLPRWATVAINYAIPFIVSIASSFASASTRSSSECGSTRR